MTTDGGATRRAVVALDPVVASTRDASPAEVAAAVLRLLVHALGADGGALLLMDPHTGLFWTGAVDGLPAASCHPFFARELEADAARSFRRLASNGAGASALTLRSPGDPFRAEVLEPFGFRDEVRVVARDADVAWGAISLWRRLGTEPFTLEDEQTLDGVAATVGEALRDAVLRSLCDPGSREATHAVLVVEGGAVVESSPEARRLLHEIDEPDADRYRPLDHLVALTRTRPRFSAVVGTAAGRWVTAHGTALDESRAVVVLTAPGPADLFGALVASAGLTAREVEVTRLLCRGLTDTEIARELTISPHTAHDHVRAVRSKLGVRSRAEVATRVFADRYFDRFLASAAIAHAGDPPSL